MYPAFLLNYDYFLITDLPKPACQNCPSVEESPAMKTVLEAFCLHDFGKFKSYFTTLICYSTCMAMFLTIVCDFLNRIIDIFFFFHSCDCQNPSSTPPFGRARIWGWRPCWVYPPGTSPALWHPAPTAAVAPHQPAMCQYLSASWKVTVLRADWFCAEWWHPRSHPALPLAQKRHKHGSGHSQVEASQMFNGLIVTCTNWSSESVFKV